MAGFTSRNELLSSRLARFTRVLHGVEKGSVDAIHHTRVASRRLREVLPILQLDGDRSAKLRRRLRKVTRRLGRPRELDVLLLLIDELRRSRRYSARALKLVRDEVTQARRASSIELDARATESGLKRVARKLGRVSEELQATPDTPVQLRAMRWAIAARVIRRSEALTAAFSDAGQVYLAERLHAVRIAMKKLRYGLELSVEAAGERDSSDLRALKRGQELLGRMHDLQVLIDRVRRVQGGLTPPDLVLWREMDGLVVSLENSCRRPHGRYMRERPSFIALCERYRGKKPTGGIVAARRTG
jgi:CHAD domain-containing protein